MIDFMEYELHEAWDSFSEAHQSFLVSNAIKQDEISLYRFFISKGIDVNFETETGDTFLSSSICVLDYDLISFLIGKGANMNFKNMRGESPLFFSIYHGMFEDSLLLLQNGASLDSCYESTPHILKKIVNLTRDQIKKMENIGMKHGTVSENMIRKIKGEKMKELVR